MSWIAVAIIGARPSSAAAVAPMRRAAPRTRRPTRRIGRPTRSSRCSTRSERPAGAVARGGLTSLGDIVKGFGAGGYFGHQFGARGPQSEPRAELRLHARPGHPAPTTNMANAMGGLGGNSLAEISKWTTGFAGNAYQQAYQNYTANQTNIFNRLASIAGLGQTAGSNSEHGRLDLRREHRGAQMGAGNALAAGQVGSANAWSGALNNAWAGISSSIECGEQLHWGQMGRVAGPGLSAGARLMLDRRLHPSRRRRCPMAWRPSAA
jgi:hypothetical protein